MENGSKFTDSLKLYNWFFVGSEYLKNYVIKKNNEAKVEVIPTCVDYEKYEPKVYNLQKEEIVFGWIGGNHNLNLLDIIIAPLNKIAEKHKISLLVISGIEYNNERANFNIINKQWSLETEIEDIKLIDIGLMPLKNTKEDKGKAGFKLIQYMGLGVVSIASAVTVNRDIIDNEINGFLVYDDQWELVIEKCIQNHLKFEHYGHEARKKILKSYSFIANFDDYKNFLNI